MVYNVNKKLVSKCQLSKRSPIFTISIQSLPYIVHILPWTIFEINFLLERMKLSLQIFQRTFKIVMRSLMFKFNNFPRAVVSQYRSKVCLKVFKLHHSFSNENNHSFRLCSQCIREAEPRTLGFLNVALFHNVDLNLVGKSFWSERVTRGAQTHFL